MTIFDNMYHLDFIDNKIQITIYVDVFDNTNVSFHPIEIIIIAC